MLIVVMLLGNSVTVKFLQPAKAQLPILVKELGKVESGRSVQ